MKTVISLYDYTGEAVKPWASKGYQCYCYDIQHEGERVEGNIHYIHADLHSYDTIEQIISHHAVSEVAMVLGWPVCTDLTVAGACHWKKKGEVDPLFQEKAMTYARMCEVVGNALDAPYMIENPVGYLNTHWRKPDHMFHPYEYGGYIPVSEAEHPVWPKYIAPQDAYTKKTCLWVGNGFNMPEKRPVEPEKGQSRQYRLLGGKSDRTKNIRSATPRGFAQAVMEANS